MTDKTIPGIPIEPAIEEFLTKPYFDEDGVQVTSGIGPDGKEYPDPHPLEPPVGFVPPPDLMDTIRRMVQSEMGKAVLDQHGMETFEEAGDFDIEDDPGDPLTPHEALFYPPDEPKKEPVVTGPEPKGQVSGAGSPEPPAPAPAPAPSDKST